MTSPEPFDGVAPAALVRHSCAVTSPRPGFWDVACLGCDFRVSDLSSDEAAVDTVRWHQGKPSYLGGQFS